jgi:hypothetical protein
MNAVELLKERLRDAVHPGHILEKITPVLEGFWKFSFPESGAYALSRPVFTRQGDLILELRTYVEEKVVIKQTANVTVNEPFKPTSNIAPPIVLPTFERPPKPQNKPSCKEIPSY